MQQTAGYALEMTKPIQVVLAGAKGVRLRTAKALSANGRSDVIVVQGDKVEVILGTASARPAEVEATIDRLASSVREAMAAYAPARSSMVPALHDLRSGRIDAKLVAAYLDVPLSTLARAVGKDYKAVFKSPGSAALQPGLAPIHRTVVAMERIFGSRSSALAWLNSPNGELDGRTPLSVVMAGRAEVVADMLEGTLAGVIG
jgi:hypothetical protein